MASARVGPDGTDFNAEAVKFWINRIADKDNNRALASYLGPTYDSTEVIDPLTAAKIKLKTPNATLLRRMTRYYFGLPSPTAVEKAG
ncbi:MAG: ABC transporter substrate-binding protein [Dehalococcoidia bacterium]